VTSLLELYDQERRSASETGMRREEVPGLVRQIDLLGTSSAIIFTDLGSSHIDAAIDQQVAYFAQLGHDFEWKVFAHDSPPDLVERLRARGFEIDEPEAIMALDLSMADAELFAPSPHVRRGTEPDEVPEHIRDELRMSPEALSVYVAELDGLIVAHGWVRFPPNSPFASLWGGETDPPHRGKGLYSQLVRARLREARQRGYAYVTVDARSTSRPILARKGFQVLTWATACTWAGRR
jgi:ribosomal protein S18 acetylase RimI-like enzyme